MGGTQHCTHWLWSSCVLSTSILEEVRAVNRDFTSLCHLGMSLIRLRPKEAPIASATPPALAFATLVGSFQ
jgi:hypothetical protein